MGYCQPMMLEPMREGGKGLSTNFQKFQPNFLPFPSTFDFWAKAKTPETKLVQADLWHFCMDSCFCFVFFRQISPSRLSAVSLLRPLYFSAEHQ